MLFTNTQKILTTPQKSTSSWFVSADKSTLKAVTLRILDRGSKSSFSKLFQKKILPSNHLMETKNHTADLCLKMSEYFYNSNLLISEKCNVEQYKTHINSNTFCSQPFNRVRVIMYKSGDIKDTKIIHHSVMH